jgi:ABC-type transporter Mla subunit MlaD
VNILLKIYKENPIYSDARFVIEAANFLGDQYVAIVPGLNQGPVLTNNAVVNCETPFNIQEVARNAAGFIDRIDGTAQRLNEAIADVRRLVLNEETLTNLAGSIGTMRRASEHALSAVDNLNALIDTNRPAVAEALSNVVYFSDQINSFADKFGDVLTTNSTELTTSMKNISASSMALKSILDDAQSGKGLIGTVLKNDVLATNVAAIAENLSITSSNLNSLGLWRVLFPKHPKSNTPPAH